VRWSLRQLAALPEGKLALAQKRVALLGAVYELDTGTVRFLAKRRRLNLRPLLGTSPFRSRFGESACQQGSSGYVVAEVQGLRPGTSTTEYLRRWWQARIPSFQ